MKIIWILNNLRTIPKNDILKKLLRFKIIYSKKNIDI